MKKFIATLQAWGPLGVFFIAIIDSLSIPVPGGVDGLVILFAVKAPESAYFIAAIAALGSVIGSIILFYIARRGGEAYFERHAQTRRGARVKRWFLEYGLLTVLVPAMVPIPFLPMKLFVVASGAFQVNVIAFTAVLVAARIPRYFALAWLGKRLGPQTLPYLGHHAWQLLGFSALLFLALYLLIKFVDRRRKLRQLVSDSE
ncbi:MAG: VTT domain-containing protein [Bryobacteraceae bacterium]